MPETKPKRPATTGDKKSKRVKTEESLNYDPVHFIRSHSKNNDPADVQTQIWEVVFEPDPEDSSKTLSNVATCGGNSICIIDVNSGTVLMKYKHKDIRENFYTLAWTTLDLGGQRTNILASGGIKGEVRMFHPAHKVCFHEWKPVERKGTAVNSLVFHSSEPTWLFVGTNDGYVSLFDVGTPTLPTYDGVHPKQLLKLFPDYGDVYNIAWSGHNSKWLLAGTAAGLVGWKIEADIVRETKARPFMVDFLLPDSEKDKDENPIVDSLAIVSEYTIVAKCANHGLIYLWDLRATTKDLSAKNSENVVDKEVSMLANLKWSDTDNFYMNLGCHKGKGLIVCGDDKGSLWLYNMPGMVNKNPEKSLQPLSKIVDPTTRLMWPELQDDHLENSRKVPLDRHDIIIDKVTTSWDCNHIVAVTSNNMVCIWKRTDEDSSDS
jgi:WD40 repeat protein